MRLLFSLCSTSHQKKVSIGGKIMQITMQMNLAKLKNADWQVDGWKPLENRLGSLPLPVPCALHCALEGGDAGSQGHSPGTQLLSVSKSAHSRWPPFSPWRVATQFINQLPFNFLPVVCDINQTMHTLKL
jgi:hypothetical protein